MIKETHVIFYGNSSHVHRIILDAIPLLTNCGGYSLFRTAECSKELIEIENADGGMSVSFLRDILSQAKLYVRPLQFSILLEKTSI
jgi:hypothetical protein